MCGIYGFQFRKEADLSIYDKTVFVHYLAREMESRGRDSFGGIILPKGDIFKGLGKVTDNGIKLLRQAAESKYFLAHTRAATTGEVIHDNCHPFTVGDVVGVHNGVIYNHEALNKIYHRDCQVDSQHIFYHINEGLDLGDVEGYGTFFWSKKSEDYERLYFSHTNSGSLTVVRLYLDSTDKVEDNIAVVWASETFGIKKAADILGLQWRYVMTSPDLIHVIEGGQVYKTNDKAEFKAPQTFTTRRSGKNTFVESPGINEYDDETYDPIITPWGISGKFNPITTNSKYLPRSNKDLDADESISKGLAAFIACQNTQVNKRDKRKIRRRIDYFRSKTLESHKPPTVLNIHKGVGFPRYWMRRFDGGKEVAAACILQCKECGCDLRYHIWGWCLRDNKTSCKAKIGTGCNNMNLAICEDCGHYLAEGVHQISNTYDVVHCVECNDLCLPLDSIITVHKKDEEANSSDDEEVIDILGYDDDEEETKSNVILYPGRYSNATTELERRLDVIKRLDEIKNQVENDAEVNN